jgi:hypothetical protein
MRDDMRALDPRPLHDEERSLDEQLEGEWTFDAV